MRVRKIQVYNVWANSNIREWLNSVSQKVDFTTQEPVRPALIGAYSIGGQGDNPYADEPGFLSNFTQNERNVIRTITHDGVSDQVYLLSIDEVIRYIGDSDEQRTRVITAVGKQNCETSENNDGTYWTRTPEMKTPYNVRTVRADGSISYAKEWALAHKTGEAPNAASAAAYGGCGILPALNLEFEITIFSGDGSSENPYIVASDSKLLDNSTIKVNIDGVQLKFDVQPQVINQRTMVPLRAFLEALGFSVIWDGENKKITCSKFGSEIVLQIDNSDCGC